MKTGVLLALLSAALFGASTPLAKIVLGSVDPWTMAGLLYLGAGLGLAVCAAFLEKLCAFRLLKLRCAVGICLGWPLSLWRAALLGPCF